MSTKFVSLSKEEFAEEAMNIIEKAKSRGIVLRILGALAVYIHSKHERNALEIYSRIGRFGVDNPTFTDLDLIAYGKQRGEIVKLFEKELKFNYNALVKALFMNKRLIYFHPKNQYQVDIFFDKLEFSHDVVFGDKPGKGRLDLDYPTITLTDLVLEKIQIHQINLKDIVDLIITFYGHDVNYKDDQEYINGKYIAKILSDDWGFWYDAITNLNKVKLFVEKFHNENKLTKEEKELVNSRIDKLIKIIDEEPKSGKWRKRAEIGTSKPWYREVEEVTK
ncbi:MAG: hypothetical protein QXY40_10045 [Candidatus Methanomethylicia archaeon]